MGTEVGGAKCVPGEVGVDLTPASPQPTTRREAALSNIQRKIFMVDLLS
jgi:hypothetical protein